MRWYTCTPVAFSGGADFFARDSGLLCRGFQRLGIESKAVMLLPAGADDEADLIRTEMANLESAEWWRSQRLDGVVLYAWGRPKFRKVAEAIRRAGAFLVLNQDSGGLVSPRAGLVDWWREQEIVSGQGVSWNTRLRGAVRVLKGLTAGWLVGDRLRVRHLRAGGVIACVSPRAADYYRKWCRACGETALAERVRVIPHAVEPMFRFSGGDKRKQVACVGRWCDEVQKRPALLVDVLERVLARETAWRVMIAGEATSGMLRWHESLPDDMRGRVKLCGKLGRADILAMMRESRVFYSSSAFESFGIAAAEALCCGCSVVAVRSVSMTSFEWFAAGGCGTLADADDAEGHARALGQEFEAWDLGERDLVAISDLWCGRLHADKVAAQVLSAADME